MAACSGKNWIVLISIATDVNEPAACLEKLHKKNNGGGEGIGGVGGN